MRDLEFLQPMVSLTSWIGQQRFAAQLYPFTSLKWLCVQLRPGYHPDQPFFSCLAKPDGQFECVLWARVGVSLNRHLVPFDQDRELFTEFVNELFAIDDKSGE